MQKKPLYPVPMHPVFRGGRLTSWGGEKLRSVYGKPIAEVPTGESLYIPTICPALTLSGTGRAALRVPHCSAKEA